MELKPIQLTQKHSIGGHEPVFIISEVGSNWKTFDDCIHSIAMAKACGADAVKFQLYDRQALYGFKGPIANALPIEWLPKLKAHSDAIGIEFMCSAFSPELVEAVNPYVSVHKVASAELTHVRMLEKIKRLGKPVILSTGASGDGDITRALSTLGDLPCVLMYCIAAYPAQSVRLEHIGYLRSRFHRLVGFSDHTTDMFTAPAEAIFQHKAVVLEKHFNAIDGLTGPDSGHSLDVSQFKLMVTRCRNNLAIEARQSAEEKDMYLRHNRRLIAIKDIKPGDILKEKENFDICRSMKDDTKALSPFLIDSVNGKKATTTIPAGDGIGPKDIA